MKILGLDVSYNNWGYSIAEYQDKLIIKDTGVFTNKTKKDKKQRQNIIDYNRAKELYKYFLPLVSKVDVICVELPTGSKSSRAMVSYALCCSVMACLSHTNNNVVVVTPMQVKRIVGSSTASKSDVISWVKQRHDYLDLSVKCRAEHIADSIVAIYAGLNL